MKISAKQKKDIIQHMLYVVRDKKGKLLALSFATFLENLHKKTDDDFIILVKEIQDIVFNHQNFALNQLGYSFFYFKNFRFLQDDHMSVMIDALVNLLVDDVISNHPFFKKKQSSAFRPGGFAVVMEKESPETVERKDAGTGSQSKRNQHIDEVGECYEGFKMLLHGLFADMQPTSFSEPVNDRISEVYKKLSDLRNLACKYLPE